MITTATGRATARLSQSKKCNSASAGGTKKISGNSNCGAFADVAGCSARPSTSSPKVRP